MEIKADNSSERTVKLMASTFIEQKAIDAIVDVIRERDQLQRQNDELVVRVARLEKWIKQDLEILDEYQENDEYMACLKLLNEAPTQSLQHVEAAAVERFAEWFDERGLNGYDSDEVWQSLQKYIDQLRQQSTNGSDGDE